MINNGLDYAEALLEACPKAAEKFETWVGGRLFLFQQKIAEQLQGSSVIPELDKLIIKNAAKHALQTNIRCLYDFFDEQGIYVVVLRTKDKHWIFETDGNEYFDRLPAEIAAFEDAFKQLENGKDS